MRVRKLLVRRLIVATMVIALGPAAVAATQHRVLGELPELTRFGDFCAGVAALLTAVGAISAWLVRHRGRQVQRMVLLVTAAVSGLIAGVWSSVGTVYLAVDRGETAPWAPVWLFAWPALLLLGTRIACGNGPRIETTTRPDPMLPRVQLPPEGAAVWQTRLTAGIFLLGAVVLTTVGSAAASVSGPLTVVCWVMAVLSVLLARMRLRLDDAGVSLSPWGIPGTTKIPYARIAAARVEHLKPLRLSGPSERVLAGDCGVVLRSGPGLVIELADGRRLGIMMSTPEVPAGIINAQLDRLRHGVESGTGPEPSRR